MKGAASPQEPVGLMTLRAEPALEGPRLVSRHSANGGVGGPDEPAAPPQLDPVERLIVASAGAIALGELAPGAAHEINNSLCAIFALIEFLLADASHGTKERQRLELVQQSADEIREVVATLVDFARKPPERHEQVSVEQVSRKALACARRMSLAKEVDIVERYARRPLLVNGSESQLRQAVLALALAAVGSGPRGRSIAVEGGHDDGEVVLAVVGAGRGVSGLGVELARGIAHVHRGRLVVDDRTAGVTLELRMPALEERL